MLLPSPASPLAGHFFNAFDVYLGQEFFLLCFFFVRVPMVMKINIVKGAIHVMLAENNEARTTKDELICHDEQ